MPAEVQRTRHPENVGVAAAVTPKLVHAQVLRLLRMRYPIRRYEWVLLHVVVNLALVAALVVNKNGASPDEFFASAKELVSFHLPSSNYYPIGSALLLIPFAYLPGGGTIAVLFYANVGFVALALIVRRLLSPFAIRLGAVLLIANTYLFWVLAGSRDNVLEFAVVPLALWAVITRRPAIWIFASTMAVLVRPGNLLWVVVVSVLLAIRWKRAKALAPVGFVVAVMVMNVIAYGSFAVSQNGGYAARIGWTQEHLLTHPLYEYDVGISDPYSIDNSKSMSGAEKYERFMSDTRRAITDEPIQSIQLAMSKLESSLFHVSKVPRFNFPASAPGDGSVVIEAPTFDWGRTGAEVVYFVQRAVSLSLFLFALVALIFIPSIRLPSREHFLLAPFFGMVPMAILVTADTRFQITAEVLAMLWTMHMVTRVRELSQRMRTAPLRDETQAVLA